MEVSKLIFTKETKNKMEQGLNIAQRGKLRWSKLEGLYNDGRLQNFKNRNEVAKAVGFMPEQMKRGYGWVTNMINRGHLTEVAMGLNKYGKMEYQYFLTNTKPDYSHGKKKSKSPKTSTKAKTMQPKAIEKPAEQIILSRASVETSYTKVTITHGDTTITIENADSETLIKIVMGVVKGVDCE